MPKGKRVWASALCWGCRHLNQKEVGVCKAFPGGIPHAIISNEVDHFTPLKGQPNDLVYEPKKVVKRR